LGRTEDSNTFKFGDIVAQFDNIAIRWGLELTKVVDEGTVSDLEWQEGILYMI